MPNILDKNGLQIMSQAELIAYYTAAYQASYGPDINLNSNSPDGQMMMAQVQAALDNLELQMMIYNSMDPDNAIGVTLDQRVAINGIERLEGTFTLQNLLVTVSQAVTLPGLDQSALPVFTYADNAGNQWQLITTQNPGAAGSYTYEFQAANPGAIFSLPNTINVPVTVILGVTSVNNPTPYTYLGIDEETDAALRLRRQKSTRISSQGFLDTILAAVLNVNGVTSANIYENVTDSTDVNGVPSHSIWVVIQGNPADSDVANAIYGKRNAGCGMFGAKTFTITQSDGSPFVIKWDVVTQENLFIQFTATSLDGFNPPNTAAILAKLPVIFVPGVYEQVNINDLATLVQEIDPNTLVTNAGFSTSNIGPFTNTLKPTARNKQFLVTAGNINIL